MNADFYFKHGVHGAVLGHIPWLALCLLMVGVPLRSEQAEKPDPVPLSQATGFIQSAALDPTLPLFVPTHPRVTTTIRFPSAVGAPDGRGFTEDENKQPGEYLVSWSQGDPHFTLTPLRNAGPLNLNVPYQGSTYVFYFYPVERQFQAVASLVLSEPKPNSATVSPNSTAPVQRLTAPPTAHVKAATPARMLGMIDRLKLLASLGPGPQLAELIEQLDLELALPLPAHAKLGGTQPPALPPGVSGWLSEPSPDCGLYEIRILQALRDRRLNSIGFALLIRNRSSQAIALDVSSFAARTGTTYLPQFVSDAPAILPAGEEGEAYFAVNCPRATALLAANEWKLSVDLLSPLVNPGAACVRKFAESK